MLKEHWFGGKNQLQLQNPKENKGNNYKYAIPWAVGQHGKVTNQ
jgi:hypothetical protein